MKPSWGWNWFEALCRRSRGVLSTLRRSISSPNAWLSWTATRDGRGQLTLTGVAVEKLLPTKFAKIKLRQEALQSIFSGRLDIFYPPNFGCLGRKASFSTATGYCNNNRTCTLLVQFLTCRPGGWHHPEKHLLRPETFLTLRDILCGRGMS